MFDISFCPWGLGHWQRRCFHSSYRKRLALSPTTAMLMRFVVSSVSVVRFNFNYFLHSNEPNSIRGVWTTYTSIISQVPKAVPSPIPREKTPHCMGDAKTPFSAENLRDASAPRRNSTSDLAYFVYTDILFLGYTCAGANCHKPNSIIWIPIASNIC